MCDFSPEFCVSIFIEKRLFSLIEDLEQGTLSTKETREDFRELMSNSSDDEAAWVIALIERCSFKAITFSGLETLVDLNLVTHPSAFFNLLLIKLISERLIISDDKIFLDNYLS